MEGRTQSGDAKVQGSNMERVRRRCGYRDSSRGRSAPSGVCAGIKWGPGPGILAARCWSSWFVQLHARSPVLGKAAVINASPGAETGEDTADDGCVLNPGIGTGS